MASARWHEQPQLFIDSELLEHLRNKVCLDADIDLINLDGQYPNGSQVRQQLLNIAEVSESFHRTRRNT